jgi:hypothetical protein
VRADDSIAGPKLRDLRGVAPQLLSRTNSGLYALLVLRVVVTIGLPPTEANFWLLPIAGLALLPLDSLEKIGNVRTGHGISITSRLLAEYPQS